MAAGTGGGADGEDGCGYDVGTGRSVLTPPPAGGAIFISRGIKRLISHPIATQRPRVSLLISLLATVNAVVFSPEDGRIPQTTR